MKKKLALAVAGLVFGSAMSAPVEAATSTGTVNVAIVIYLRGALGPLGSVNCSATVALSPDPTPGSLTIANVGTALLAQGGVQNGGVPAIQLSAARTSFYCIVPVPYNFINVSAGQKLVVAIDVRGQDPGSINPLTGGWTPPATIPSRSRQVVSIIDPPATPTTTRIPTTGWIAVNL